MIGAYIGYLEHAGPALLDVPTANIGKGGWTIFSRMIEQRCGYGFQGLPWCTTYVFAVHPARDRLGPPCVGVRELARRMHAYGRWRGRHYSPQPGDLVFVRTGRGRIGHCGIVVAVTKREVISADGNTRDPSGVFGPKEGGAVAIRSRSRKSIRIAGYAAMQ